LRHALKQDVAEQVCWAVYTCAENDSHLALIYITLSHSDDFIVSACHVRDVD